MEVGCKMRHDNQEPVWPVGPIIKTRAVEVSDNTLVQPLVKTEDAILPDKQIIYSVKIEGEDPSEGPQVWHIVKKEDNADGLDESNAGVNLQDGTVNPHTGEGCAELREKLLLPFAGVCDDTQAVHMPEEKEVNIMVNRHDEDNPNMSQENANVTADIGVRSSSISKTKFPICRFSMQTNRTSKRQACNIPEKLGHDSVRDIVLNGGEAESDAKIQSRLSAGSTEDDISHDSEDEEVCIPLALHPHRYEPSAVLEQCGIVGVHAASCLGESCTKHGLVMHSETQGTVGSCKGCRTHAAFITPGDNRRQSAGNTGVVKPYRCKLCQKYFSSMDTLRGHYLVHSGQRPLTCDICQKSFNHLSNLRRHKRIHTGVKPYTCSTCGKSFTRLSTLKTHGLTHSEDRPYTCATCGKSFAEKSKLTTHSQSHTGERPYTCITCGKSFAWLSILKKHSLTHTGLKPYICFLCGKRFADPSALKTHGLTHTGERPFTCNICGKGFTTQSNLTSHGVTHRQTSQASPV